SAASLSGRIGQLNDLVATFRTRREATGGRVAAPVALRATPAPAAPVRAAAAPAPTRPKPSTPNWPAATPAAPAAGASEPERLRQLAEAAFVQSRTLPAKAAPAPRKVANARAQDAGWEEF
ncbi:hypothetical protein ACWKW2_22050, partial [Bosea thiooxidans]